MQNPIVRGFANIARFGGRDTRVQFWPYAAAAAALYLVVGSAVLTPILWPAFGAETSATAFDDVAHRFLLVSLILFVLLVALLAAAVARRLHDSGRSALWGLLPLPFAAYSGTMFVRLVDQFEVAASPDMVLFLSVFVSNVLYMVGVGILIVLLVLNSTPAPNRYG